MYKSKGQRFQIHMMKGSHYPRTERSKAKQNEAINKRKAAEKQLLEAGANLTNAEWKELNSKILILPKWIKGENEPVLVPSFGFLTDRRIEILTGKLLK